MRTARLLLGLVLLLGGVAAPPALAATCPSPGNATWATSQPASNGDFVFVGRGFGHGVGMSQYGARGAAALGCTAEQILTTYYSGVEVGPRPMPSTLRVGLKPNATPGGPVFAGSDSRRPTSLSFTNTSSVPVPWLFDNTDIRSLGGPAQAPGTTWQVVLKSGSSTAFFVVLQDGRELWRSQSRSTATGKSLVAALDSKRVLRVAEKSRSYHRGRLELTSTSSGMVLSAVVPFEQYLYGLAEMPSSWDHEALRAQAIVGRSYAAVAAQGSWRSNCRCDLYDTVQDQHYVGHDKETEGRGAVYGKRWLAAVDASRGRVLHRSGTLLTGNYASSHGGHSEDSAFVWGGGASHLRAVDDSRWEAASGNPYSSWTARFTPERLGRAFGVGVALEVQLPSPKGVSGRIGDPARGAGGVRVIGTTGTAVVSGSQARTRLGLRSAYFGVVNPPPPGTAVVGDWNGDRRADLGWYRDGTFTLRRADGSVSRFRFGRPGDVPVVGDWNGDGRDGIGVVRGRTWFLRDSASGGPANRVIEFGRPGDQPMPGNWNPNRRGDEIGVVRDGRWLLANGLRGGGASWSFTYGRRSGDTPVAGDWYGSGRDGVGVVRDGTWHVRRTLSGGSADTSFDYGRSGGSDVPLVGDWDGDRDVTPGVVRGVAWYLRDGLSGGGAHRTITFRG